MKKFLTIISCTLLVALLALTFSGCSKDGDIKTAFKNAGYEVTSVKSEDCKELSDLVGTYVTNLNKQNTDDDSKKKEVKKEDVINKFKIYTVSFENRKGAFIKCPSEKALELALGETNFKSKTDSGYINGNCYFITTCTIGGTSFYKSANTDALYIFKNA